MDGITEKASGSAVVVAVEVSSPERAPYYSDMDFSKGAVC